MTRESAPAAAGDEFTRLKFVWLEQVAADPDLPPLAARLAILFASRYFNRKTREGFPGIELLAKELDADERSVQRALQRMTPKHLTIEGRGGRKGRFGDGIPNRYRWNIQTIAAAQDEPATFKGDKTDTLDAETTPTDLTLYGGSFVPSTPSKLSPKPFEVNPLIEPVEISSSVAVPPKIDDDDLRNELIGALCGQAAPGVIEEGLPTVRRWIREGHDLERHILPALSEISLGLKSKLRTFAAPFLEARVRARRLAETARTDFRPPPRPIVPGKIFVPRDGPEWEVCSARYASENGGARPPSGSTGEDGRKGWWFPANWRAEQEARPPAPVRGDRAAPNLARVSPKRQADLTRLLRTAAAAPPIDPGALIRVRTPPEVSAPEPELRRASRA